MTAPQQSTSATGAESTRTEPRQLRPGLKLLLASLLIGSASLALFCFSLGLGVGQLAGDAAKLDQPLQVRRLPLAIAMIGFGLSMLVFWIGYLRLARSRGS